MSMTGNVYEVLMYIFDHYMEEDDAFNMDQTSLASELEEVGFQKDEVRKAFAWLESLTETNRLLDSPQSSQPPVTVSMRVYNQQEVEKLPPESRGFLMYLEQLGVIDASKREMVIDRALALETDKIDLDQLKWVALMVLFNQSEEQTQLGWIEDLVFNEPQECVH